MLYSDSAQNKRKDADLERKQFAAVSASVFQKKFSYLENISLAVIGVYEKNHFIHFCREQKNFCGETMTLNYLKNAKNTHQSRIFAAEKSKYWYVSMCIMLKIIYHLTDDSIKYYTISKLDSYDHFQVYNFSR